MAEVFGKLSAVPLDIVYLDAASTAEADRFAAAMANASSVEPVAGHESVDRRAYTAIGDIATANADQQATS